MRIEDKESAHQFKKYLAEALARYQIEHDLELDDYRNWIIACSWYDDYFNQSGE